MFEIYIPTETNEFLAYLAAIGSTLIGLVMLITPRLWLRLLGHTSDAPVLVPLRGLLSGFPIGAGLCAILFAQPLIYLVLGAGWALTAFGGFVSLAIDRGMWRGAALTILVSLLLALFPLGYALGWF